MNPYLFISPALTILTLLIGWFIWSMRMANESTASQKISASVEALVLKIDALRASIAELSSSTRLAEERHAQNMLDRARVEARLTRIENDMYRHA